MRRAILILATALIFIAPTCGFSSEQADELPKWLDLLQKGNVKEKKLALRNLWFLEYQEYRKDPKVFDPILNTLLKDKEPSVREAAANTLKRIGDYSKGCCKETEIVPSLIKALEDNSPRVRQEAAKVLGYFKDDRAVDALIKTLKDKDPWVRLNVVWSLGEMWILKTVGVKPTGRMVEFKSEERAVSEKKIVMSLIELLNDDSDWRNKFVQQEAIIAIRKIGNYDKKIMDALLQKFDDEYLKIEIIKIFATFYVPETEDKLLKATEDSNEQIRRLAIEALTRFTPVIQQEPIGPKEQQETRYEPQQRTELLIKSLKDPSAKVRAKAMERLGASGDVKAVDPVLEALNDGDGDVRQKAMEALGKFKDERILDAVLPFFGQLGGIAERTFLSIAGRTSDGSVYPHRKDGTGYIVKNVGKAPISEGILYNERIRIVHPKAVGKLIDKLNKADESSKLGILNIIGKFEDNRIEPYLLKFMDDPSPQVRQRTVSLLWIAAGSNAVPKLIEALKDKDSGVRREAVSELEKIQDKRALEPLIERLKDNDGLVKMQALIAIGKFDDPRILDLNIALLKDDVDSVRSVAVGNISRKPDKKAVEPLISLLNDTVASVSAEALGIIGDKRAVDPLIKALNGEFKRNRMISGDMDLLKIKAAEALGKIGDKKAVPALLKAVEDSNLNLKITAIKALCPIKDKETVPVLIRLLSDKDNSVRYNSLLALGEIGDPSALDAMKALFDDKQFYSSYKNYIIEAIAKIKDDKAVEIITELISSSDTGVANHAIRTLGKLKNRKAIKPLVKTAGKGPLWAIMSIVYALRAYEYPVMVDIIIGYLQDEDSDIKNGAVAILGVFGEKKALAPLKKLLEDADPQMKQDIKASIRSIEAIKDSASGSQKIMMMEAHTPTERAYQGTAIGIGIGIDPEMREVAPEGVVRPRGYQEKPDSKRQERAEAIATISSEPIDIKPLITKLKDKNPKIRRDAADALGDSGDKKAAQYLIPLLKDENEYVRQAAARALGKLKDKEAVEPLIAALKDPDTNALSFTIWALGEIQDPRAAEPLAPLLLSKEAKISEQTFEAMRKFQGLASKKAMVNTLMKTSEDWMLRRLISLEGEEIVLKTFEDHGGDKTKTVRNYINLMASGNNTVSGIASKALSNYKDRGLVISEMASYIKKRDKDAYRYIIFLGNLGDPKGLPVLIETLNNRKAIQKSDGVVVIEAIGKLGGYKETEGILMEILVNPNEGGIRAHAARALGKLGDKKAVDALIKIALDDKEIKDIKMGVIAALGDIKDKRAIEPLTKIIKNTQNDVWLRGAAVSSLGDIGDESTIGVIQDAASNDSTGYIKGAAEIALRKIKTGK